MQALQIFNYQSTPIRTVTVDGEPWFVAKDVMQILGYAANSNPARLTAHVPEEWRGVNPIHTPSGEQKMITLSEHGLFFFLTRSDRPAALPMQKWVAGEVLPSIRKTGSYSVKREPLTELDRLVPAIASGMGVIRQEIEAVVDRVSVVEERQKQIDPQEIESRMFVLHKLKKVIVDGTKDTQQPVAIQGYWRALKEHVKIASFQNRAALTVELMDRAVEYARNWCFSRGVQPPSLFDQAAADERPAV